MCPMKYIRSCLHASWVMTHKTSLIKLLTVSQSVSQSFFGKISLKYTVYLLLLKIFWVGGNSYFNNHIDMKLVPVTKLDTKNTAMSKKLIMTSCR